MKPARDHAANLCAVVRASGKKRRSMPLDTLNANAAPKGAALWLQMIQAPGRAHNLSHHSGRLHGRLTRTAGFMGG